MNLSKLLRQLALTVSFVLFSCSIGYAQNSVQRSFTASAASCTINDTTCATLQLPANSNTISFDITGTFSATLQFEYTRDNGTNWRALSVTTSAGTVVTSATAAGGWTAANANYTHVRIRPSAQASGTVVATVKYSSNGAVVGVNFGGGGSTIGAVNLNDGSGNPITSTTSALDVNIKSGATGTATTDPDDASIASGQTNSNVNSLGMVYDGSVWRRLTIGTAGTASAQVLTVQGVASMTPVLATVTGNLTNISGTISLPTGASTSANQILTQAPITPATATATKSDLLGVQYNSTPTTFTNGQQGSAASTSHGVILFNPADSTGAPLSLTADVTVDCDSGGGTQTCAGYPLLVAASGGAVAVTGDAANGLDTDVTRLPALVAGTAIIGKVGIDQTTPGTTNKVDIGAGATIATNAGTAGATVLRTTEATDSQLSAAVGATGDAAATAGSTGSQAAKLRLITSQLDSIKTAVELIDNDQTGATPYFLTSAASTNSTTANAAASRLMSMSLENTTTTVYYMRFYNAASAPTCSSATNFVRTYPVPPASAAGGVGGTNLNFGPTGVAFSTGLSFCLTGGGSSTDNTNAATGVYINLDYK
jgi:hypothetical protein